MNTIEEAKEFLRKHWDEKDCFCPVCHQKVQREKRSLYGPMARVLILIYRKHQAIGFNEWINVHAMMRDYHFNCPDYTKFKYWGFLEKKKEIRDDGSNRNGMWRITNEGIAFVGGGIRARKWYGVYNDKVYGQSEELITIKEALGKKFNYDEVMGGIQ